MSRATTVNWVRVTIPAALDEPILIESQSTARGNQANGKPYKVSTGTGQPNHRARGLLSQLGRGTPEASGTVIIKHLDACLGVSAQASVEFVFAVVACGWATINDSRYSITEETLAVRAKWAATRP